MKRKYFDEHIVVYSQWNFFWVSKIALKNTHNIFRRCRAVYPFASFDAFTWYGKLAVKQNMNMHVAFTKFCVWRAPMGVSMRKQKHTKFN